MKYNNKNKPTVCMMTNSTCYKGTTKGTPVGVLWHSTGANNPTLKRYVQPSKSDPNYSELMKLIGKNLYNNDWNNIERQAGVNAWIGKLADGSVSTLQALPWDYRPWGCGSGSKGSCNGKTGGPFWIQFEICEDSLTDESYFKAAYKEACEFTAYICKTFGIDPKGTVTYNGVSVPTILCHKDSYKLGLGSDHSDVYTWFNKYGKKMSDVRNDVKVLIDEANFYKVRLTWENESSQLGAFKLLEDAIANCPVNYSVFDSDGKCLYTNEPVQEKTEQEIFDECMSTWLKNKSSLPPAPWSKEYREWAESNGLIVGYSNGEMGYKNYVTREELVVFLDRLYQLIKKNS